MSSFYQCLNYLSIHIWQKSLAVIVVFFSTKNCFQNNLYYYLIFQTKKSIYSKTSFQEMQQPLPFPPAFSDHILFYISIFLLSFMPSGSSVLRRYCSTGSFHRFPYVYLPQGFFPGLFFVNSLKCNVCPAFSPHFSSTALSYSATLSPASQCPPRLFGQAEQISSVSHEALFLSLQKNLQHLGHMCSKTVTVAFPLKIRQAHTI